MINFDYYKNEILRIVNMEEQIAVHKGEPCECSVLHDCRNCEFDCNEYETTETCDMKVVKWLCSEHKEKPKITEFERGFLVAVEKGYIARDKNKELWFFTGKPAKAYNAWIDIYSTALPLTYMQKLCFDFIKWEDKEPWSIEDLLRLEVER